MDIETMSNQNEMLVENELDIRGLCRTLWQGKTWIIGMAAAFAIVAILVSFLMKQEWSA
ncbi:Wzz/FepE/Etk N-terminal domain-containing protein, partial [Obesumbacterium proteus]